MQPQRTSIVLVLLLVVSLSSTACKEGDPISTGVGPATASFTATDPPAGVTSRLVSLRQNSLDVGRIVLDVVVTDVDEPVAGIALKLTYPDSFSKFIECTDGELFNSGQCYFAEPSPGSGEVFIGRSITAPDQPITVNGDQVIVRLEFLVFGEGQGSIDIEGQNLGGGDASALLDGDGDPIFVNWVSGVLAGQ
jgi:hypothetical protein